MLRQVFPCYVYILCVVFFCCCVLLSNLPWCHWRWQGHCPFPVPKPSNECPFPWPSCQLPLCPTPRLSPSRPLNAARARRALDSVSASVCVSASASASDCGLAFGPTCSRPALPSLIMTFQLWHICPIGSRVGHCGGGYALFPLCDCVRVMKTFSKKPSDWRLPQRDVAEEADVYEDGRQSTGAQRAVGRHVLWKCCTEDAQFEDKHNHNLSPHEVNIKKLFASY